jgi:hypothetical protein
MPYNGLGLCDGGELEAQMFGLAQMFIRMPNVKFGTSPAIEPNACVCPAKVTK